MSSKTAPTAARQEPSFELCVPVPFVASRQFIATRSGIQVSADDGPTQVILPVPDRSRVTGVAIGGPEQDTLFAFCMNKIWKCKIQQHALGAFSPWSKVTPNKL